MVNQESAGVNLVKGPWLFIAIILGLIISISYLLDAFAFGVPLGFIVPIFEKPATLSSTLSGFSVLIVGGYLGILGLRDLIIGKRFSVEFLMALAAITASYLNFLLEGVTVLFLYSLAEYFEEYVEERARHTIGKLTSYLPDVARLVKNDSETIINVKEVQPGMIIIIRPGERIPLDGKVVTGSSYLDQSIVTGESTYIHKNKGDQVFAGTLNKTSVLLITVSSFVEETLVSRIIELVTESKARKATVERLVDKFSRIYVPFILISALLTALFGPTILGGSTETWLYRSLILIVISCPSAFIISVPATMFTAITMAARKGVIIKGGIIIEKMAKVQSILFDKTGTVTSGKLSICKVRHFSKNDEQKVISYVAAIERYSNHPNAEAFVNIALNSELDFEKLSVEKIQEIPGKGIVGTINGDRIALGNKSMMREYSTNYKSFPESVDDENTCVYVSINESIVSVFYLEDGIRNDAKHAISLLNKKGVYTALLTGDNENIARNVASKLGIEQVYSELLPEGKLEIVNSIKTKNGLVAMVGDGVNDSPALAFSDVGIAMGGSGIDVALESADIVLVKDELYQIPYISRLSRAAVKIAKQNIVASLGVKILLGALGFFGLIPLWFAVAAGDDALTLMLLLNTLRLTRI